MIVTVLFLTGGIISGFFFKNKKEVIKINSIATNVLIYVLLFLLGYSIGLNEEISRNLSIIFLNTAIITFSSVLGSTIFAFFVYTRLFKKRDEE